MYKIDEKYRLALLNDIVDYYMIEGFYINDRYVFNEKTLYNFFDSYNNVDLFDTFEENVKNG